MNNAKKRVLYLGHPFHRKTKSDEFLLHQLEEKYEFDKVYFNFNKERKAMISVTGYYDILVCFQVMPSRDFLSGLHYQKGVLFPMYDAVIGMTRQEWMDYSDFLIICFSKHLHELLQSYGLNARYIQYFPPVSETQEWGKENSLFFWQRTYSIHINTILKVCRNIKLDHVHIHRAVDPGHFLVRPRGEYTCDFTYSSWFEKKEELEQVINDSAYYAAPRRYEGIGMSFLDAMAKGRCVIAPDCPTMNEYIEDGVTGILYDLEKIKPISVCNVREIQRNTLQYMQEGFQKWEKERKKIIEWMEDFQPMPYVCEKTYENQKEENAEVRKYKTYFWIFNSWLQLRNSGKKLSDFLDYTDYKKIAIYGGGQVTRRLLEEMGEERKNNVFIIDRQKKANLGNVTVYGVEDEFPQADLVIVMPVYDYEEIYDTLSGKMSCPIVSLGTIIAFLFQESM